MQPNEYDPGAYQVSSPGQGLKFAGIARKLGHWLTVLPIARIFADKVMAPLIAPILTGVATLFEVFSSLTEGEYRKAAKQAFAGTVDTVVTGVGVMSGGITFWAANALFATVSGNTISEMARQAAGWAVDGLDSTLNRRNQNMTAMAREDMVLGLNPQTRGMAVGGVGWAPGVDRSLQYSNDNFVSYDGSAQKPANFFTDREAERRGQVPEVARANWMRDDENRATFQQLEAARRAAPQDVATTRG